MGQLVCIYLRPESGVPPMKTTHAQATKGLGLEFDRFKKMNGKRQITILSQESWNDVCQELDAELDPALRKANLLVSGVDLKESIGKTLHVGDVEILIGGETVPCPRMEKGHEGLMNALKPEWRGGVYGKVIKGGEIAIGDDVKLA